MLESLHITEHLQWSETIEAENLERPVSPSQVCVDRWSSSVLRGRISSSYDVLLQENLAAGQNHKLQHHRELRGTQLIISAPARPDSRLLIPSDSRSSGDPGPSTPGHIMSVLGSPVSLAPRPALRLPPLIKASGNGENGRKKISILTAIKPSNVEREKSKFFQSGFTYNPQFKYRNPAPAQVLERHGHASSRFLTQAVRIMELTLQRYGDYERFEQATGGDLLTRSQIWTHVRKYMEKEGCVGEMVVHLSDELLSRASMTLVNGKPTLTINTSTARERWLEGMLRHEIGTHYLRGFNNARQPWADAAERKRLGLRPANPTEEGVASIHSVLFRRDPTLWRAALLYYTVHQAAHASFARLFHDLRRFLRDPGTRWDYCVRAKRGQTDTSQPGCFSKDQVYLDGILKILRHREKIDFQLLTALGKVSYEDLDRLKSLAVMDHVRIPHFLQDRARYAEQLQKIMEVNQLSDEELRAHI